MTKRKAPPKRTDDGKIEISRETWERWRHARAQAAQWNTIAGDLREILESEIADNDIATVNGVPVIKWKPTEKPRKFNQEAFKKDHPRMFAQYVELKDAPRPFNELEFDPDDIDDYPHEDDS